MIVLAVLKVILIVLLGIVALCGVAVSIPVMACVTGDGSSRGIRAEFVWLFGAVRVPIRRKPGSSSTDTTGDAGTPGGTQTRDTGSGGDGKDRKRPSVSPAEIPLIVRVIATLLKTVVRRFVVTADGDVYVGLADPADTGILWGEGFTLIQVLQRRTGIRVHPVFDGGTLAFSGIAAIRVVPITLLFPVLSTALSRDGRAVIRAIRRKR
jgi:hypothetical protein